MQTSPIFIASGLTLALFGGPAQGSAATLAVGPGQAYGTIQGAIDASVTGDIVAVDPGVYTEAISFGGRAITVQSTGGAASTTIDGGGAGSTVVFNSGEGSSALLIGFTVTGGSASGINIFVGSAPLIRDCVLTGNSGQNGGGINIWGGATVVNNHIVDNEATQGGGLYVNNVNAVVRDNVVLNNDAASGGGIFLNLGSVEGAVVSGNTASGYGGGVFAEASTSLFNGLVTANTATYGAGVHVNGGTNVRVFNSTVVDNSALGTFGAGGGIHIASGASASLRNLIVVGNTAATGGGIYSDGSNPAQFYNNVFDNSVSNYGGNALDPAGVSGNLSVDPGFSDYVPYALASGSPCIDAGDPARSFEDPDESVSDMGYYGGPGADWSPYADADGDGVHLADGDCDDTNAGNFPGNNEVCDGIDNNCSGVIDDGLNDDNDGDGYTQCDGDCDDTNGGVFPGNVEIPDDGVDQDCDGEDASEGGCTQAPAPGGATSALVLLSMMAVGVLRRR